MIANNTENTVRTIQDVQTDYTKFCTLVGQAEYQIFTIQNDIDSMKLKMRDLNIEASTLKIASEGDSANV